MINIEDFAKVEMKAGTILKVEEIEGSEKLLKLIVDLGEETPRIVLSGIRQWYKAEELENKQFLFVANLEPRKMMGQESQGMIMAVDGETRPILLTLESKVVAGSKVR